MPFRNCVTCAARGTERFCSLSMKALHELQNIGILRHTEAHETLVHEGFTADRVYVVCKGRIKITATSHDGRILLLRIAGPGDVLGLASLLRGKRYMVSADTLEPCDLKSVARDEFLRFMETFEDVSHSTMMAMAREYDAALLSARRLALSSSAGGKLARALLDWAHMGHAEEGSTAAPLSFNMPLTHEELGSMAGLSRETVTRLLSKFHKEGLIKQTGEHMVLQHPAKLEALYC